MNDLDALSREELVALVRRQKAELAQWQGEEEPVTPGYAPPARELRGFILALLAMLAAAAGEYLLRTAENPHTAIALYILAIVLLAATWPRFALRRPRPASPRRERRVRWILLAGALIATGLELITFYLLVGNLSHPLGPWLWPSGLVVLLATGLLAWRQETPSARWTSGVPTNRRARLWLIAGVTAVLLVALISRFVFLDRIPLGINPDEGDRTATAMQILRGTTERSIFDSGWYRISMMYFYALAGWLKLLGIGYVQARMFTALFGVLTVAAITWLGVRQFNARVGLIAGGILAATGLALQYSRETGEASPTAFLWALSLALFLEGARSGRSLAWIGAGLAGGFSLYFYPTGRLWPVLAAVVGLYMLVRWWAAKQGGIEALVRGLALAAISAFAVLAPFFAQYLLFPHEFAMRFQETSALRGDNFMRLHYIEEGWSTSRVVVEQLGRTLGVFSRYSDGSGFWPMHEPVLNPVFALLALVGLGVVILRVRDPRAFTLAMWICLGIVGVVVTVETPNVLRYATAVPALALVMALVLDELVRRVAALAPPERKRTVAGLATGVAALLVVAALVAESRFYFVDYARMNLWKGWNQEGRALTELPEGTLSTSLGNSFHMINSGWIRLLAPEAARGGVKAPGSVLPLAEDGARGLSFHLYPDQGAYLPWLRDLYPSIKAVDYARPDEENYFDFLFVSGDDIRQSRGAQLTWPRGAQRVERLGEPPPDAPRQPLPARWTATLRVPKQANYAFHVGPGPARLLIDGQTILEAPAGEPARSTAVQLARGDHGIVLEATSEGVDLLWASMTPGREPYFSAPTLADLRISNGVTHGLAGSVDIEGLPTQTRQDNTLAVCCLGDVLDSRNRPVSARWVANLEAPESGVYTFTLRAPGAATLTLNGASVLEIEDVSGGSAEAALPLAQGPHALAVDLRSDDGANGVLELAWTPPGAPRSIIPETALTPPRDALVLPPMPDDVALIPDAFPVDKPLDTVE